MKNLRRWSLNSFMPHSLNLAADARLGRTDYTDDQIWQLDIGNVDEPALALHTQYGGRVGLVSIVPMWRVENRVIHEHQGYAVPPTITHFTTNYIRAEAKILPDLALQVHYWAMDSHAIGGQFVLHNTGKQPFDLRSDLFGYATTKDTKHQLGIVTLEDGGNALSLGTIGNLQPVIVMEDATAEITAGRASSPKIGTSLTIQPGKRVNVRWVHAGTTALFDSVNLARFWVKQDWSAHFKKIDELALYSPQFETGDDESDLVIANSVNRLTQSLMNSTGSIPYGSFVSTRLAAYGYSRRGDGSDHFRAWSGQEPTSTYLIASVLGHIAPQFAQGMIYNYLAIQSQDGWIDRRTGLAGQRQNMLCTPILARITWNTYQHTEDKEFIKTVFPGLMKFFNRWFQEDIDVDGDGLPEWQDERQTGYTAFPTFAVGQPWSQGADIRYVESPDLAAYLLSEAIALKQLATELQDKPAIKALDKQVEALQAALDRLWDGNRYRYQDRDTHQTCSSIDLITEGPGDEEYSFSETLEPANRLIVSVTGGIRHIPKITLTIEGQNASGKTIVETADAKAFTWLNNVGVYTSETVFSTVDRIRCDGLSRMYKINVQTIDTTALDINAILPIWASGISQEREESLIKLITDKKQFWQTNGITMVPQQDNHYDPTSANGGGGVFPYWLTLISEGLLATGQTKPVSNLLKQLLKTQATILKQTHQFHEFYHPEEAIGLGTTGHLDGIFPLYLLELATGIRVISPSRVWTGGEFAWGRTITVQQHGVKVRRTTRSIQIQFPSGHKAKLPADAPWQVVTDPKPAKTQPFQPIKITPPEQKTTAKRAQNISIEVEYDE